MTGVVDPAALKATISLESVVSSHVTLHRQGRRLFGLCPFHNEKTPSFTVYDDGHYHCFGCGAHGDVIDFMMKAEGLAFQDALDHLQRSSGEGPTQPPTRVRQRARDRDQAVSYQRRIDAARKLWQRSRPAPGTLVERYLRTRGITCDIPATIRFLPDAMHPGTGLVLPAMVAAITAWPMRKVTAIHRTFLTADGRKKAPVAPDKAMLGPVKGGAVRLATASERLAVSEGVETGLSVMQATGWPTWAGLSAPGIEALTLPYLPLAAEVTIAADNDTNGRGKEAAEKAAERWAREGRRVCIALPDEAGQDFNDRLRADEEAA